MGVPASHLHRHLHTTVSFGGVYWGLFCHPFSQPVFFRIPVNESTRSADLPVHSWHISDHRHLEAPLRFADEICDKSSNSNSF